MNIQNNVRYYLFLSIIVAVTSAHAQISNIYGSGGKVLRETKTGDITDIGEAYLFETWNLALLVDYKGRTDSAVANYDSFNDRIHILNGEQRIELNPLVIRKAVFTDADRSHVIIENGYHIEDFTAADYFQILFDGRVKLIKRINSEYRKQNGANYGVSGSSSAVLETTYEYYLVDDSVAVRLKRNRSNFCEYLEQFQTGTECNLFVKRNKISLKEERNLVQVLNELIGH